MAILTGPALVAAALLSLAGAQKVVDPAMTVGALRALRLPSSPGMVRAAAAAELGLGVCAVVVGGWVAWSLVALSYALFAAFVVAALRKGTMIGSCGCFGREETPPHLSHVLLNVSLAAVSAGAAGSLSGSVVDQLADRPGTGLVLVLVGSVTLYLLHATYVELPRALIAAKSADGGSLPGDRRVISR